MVYSPRMRKKENVNSQGVLLQVRLKSEFLERIDEFCKENKLQRSSFIRRCVESYLNDFDLVKKGEGSVLTKTEKLGQLGDINFSDVEKQKIVRSALRLDEALDRKLAEAMAQRENLLDDLDSKTLAQLVIGRVPKMDVGDRDFNNEALDLRECLKGLPESSAWSGAVTKNKESFAEVVSRLSILEKKIKVYETEKLCDEVLIDFCRTVFEEGLRFVGEMIVIRELPGYANGKCCLSDRQRELSDKAVLKCLDHILNSQLSRNVVTQEARNAVYEKVGKSNG